MVQLLPALASGGVERSTLEVAEALVRAGHRSIVVSAGGRLVECLLQAGSEHIDLDIGRKSLLTLRHVFSLRRLFAELRPDIVHARSRLPAWLGLLALRGYRQQPRPHFITTVHGLNSPGWYSGVMTRGERVVCVSQTVRDHVLAQWPGIDQEKLVVIERGISPKAFEHGQSVNPDWRRRWEAEFPALAGGKLLLLPGRGTRLKGHAAAIELLAAIRARGVDARLWLLGTRERGREDYVRELETLAQSLGVAPFLAISAPRGDIPLAYAQSDLVLQLSERPEAFGRTVLEALSVGRPVLGWALGGVGEQLRRLFPSGAVIAGDHAALLARALELLDNPHPAIPPMPDTLTVMQEKILKVYESLVV